MVPAHQDVQTEACWDSHKQVGTKKKGGKTVPNCVPKESSKLSELSNDKVHNYLSKSMHQSDDAKSRGDSKLRAKREKGIKLGLKKQTGTAKVASTESYQQVLEASSNYLSKDDLPAKVKRVVINIFKLAKSKKKKIVRLSVELVGKKYYVYVELGRDNNDEDFVGRIMDMETGREKFLEIHPSASVHPAPNVSIREAVQQVEEAYFSVQFRDEKGKADSSSKNFKSASAAKKYADNANKTTKVGSYTTNKVQGRMESFEQVAEAKKVLPTAHSAVKHVSSGLGTKKLNSDGSATITTKSATMADHVLRGMNDHGIEHNNSEKALKNHKQSGKHAETGKKFKVQVSSKDGRTHTIHVKESVEQVDEKVVPYNKELLARMIDLVQDYLVDMSSHGDITEKDYKSAMAVIKKIAGDKVAAEVSSDKAISKLLYGRHGVFGTDIMRDRQGLSGRKKNKSGKLSKVSMSNFKKDVERAMSKHQKVTRKLPESVEQVDEGVLNDIRDFIVAVGAAIPTKKNKKNAKDKALEDQIRMAMEADPEFDKIVRSVVFVRKDGVAAFKQGGRDKLDKYVFKTVDAKVAAKLGTLQKGYIRTMASGEKRNLGQNPRFNKGEKKAKEQGKIVYGDDMSSTQRQTTHDIGKIIKQVAKRAYDDAKKEQKNESFRQVEEGRKLVLNINPKWSMKEVNREIKDTTQEIKQGQADHKRRPMNPTQADQHWQRKHYLEKLVALRKKKKSLGEDTMSDSISGDWGKVNEALSDVVVKKMQDMVGGPKNMPRGPEFRALKAKAQAAVAAEKKAKKAAPKAKTTTKTAKGKTHKGSADASDRNIIMQLRIAQDSMNHGDKTGDVLVSPTRTVALSKGKIDALLKKHDAIQKPVDKRKFVVLMTKALRGMK